MSQICALPAQVDGSVPLAVVLQVPAVTVVNARQTVSASRKPRDSIRSELANDLLLVATGRNRLHSNG
jgi:hypothetical protein